MTIGPDGWANDELTRAIVRLTEVTNDLAKKLEGMSDTYVPRREIDERGKAFRAELRRVELKGEDARRELDTRVAQLGLMQADIHATVSRHVDKHSEVLSEQIRTISKRWETYVAPVATALLIAAVMGLFHIH